MAMECNYVRLKQDLSHCMYRYLLLFFVKNSTQKCTFTITNQTHKNALGSWQLLTKFTHRKYGPNHHDGNT